MKKADGLETLFCDVDDFCQKILPHWRCKLISQRQRQRSFTMSPSEVMTIIIHFHRSHYRNFKNYYLSCICGQALRQEFPRRVSYNRFVELMQSVLIPLSIYLHLRRVSSRGIAFIDSTPIAVCHNRRITRHRTFVEVAQRGKNSIGWFYGFKLHLVVDDQGELISFFVTPGNVDDRKGLEKMSKFIKGQLFGDKGYISKALVEALWDKGCTTDYDGTP